MKTIEKYALSAVAGGAPAPTIAQIRNSTDPIAAAQLANPYVQDKWGDPYLLGGDYVQKNSITGEVRTAVNVPAPSNPSDNISGEQLKQFINQQTATPEFKALSEEEKQDYIRAQGGDPYNFGY